MRSLISVLCLAFVAPLWAQSPGTVKKPATSKFLRITRDAKNQPLALETATVRYVPASGEGDLIVDLVGAVHVGDREYYQKLNKQLAKYDVVLYELVAPPGTRIPKGGKRDRENLLSQIQQIVKTVLDLDLQTEQIDYTRKNFVHADLSPDQMAEAVRKRGDNGFTLFLGVMSDFLRQQNLLEAGGNKSSGVEDADVDLFSLFLDPDGPTKMKRLMARQFAAMDSPDSGLGKTLGTILIADRNQAALKVFQKELASGKKKIAIFYGAAHMPDFEKHLREDFGLKRAGDQWLTAWDLRPKKRGLEDLLKLFDQ
jgi:hypothetical protein